MTIGFLIKGLRLSDKEYATLRTSSSSSVCATSTCLSAIKLLMVSLIGVIDVANYEWVRQWGVIQDWSPSGESFSGSLLRPSSGRREKHPEVGAWKTDRGETSWDVTHGSLCVVDGSNLWGWVSEAFTHSTPQIRTAHRVQHTGCNTQGATPTTSLERHW